MNRALGTRALDEKSGRSGTFENTAFGGIPRYAVDQADQLPEHPAAVGIQPMKFIKPVQKPGEVIVFPPGHMGPFEAIFGCERAAKAPQQSKAFHPVPT